MFTPKHTPQPFTLKLLNLGIIEFSETIPNHYDDGRGTIECYEIPNNHIMMYPEPDVCMVPVYRFMEVYTIDDEFEKFKVLDSLSDTDIDINELEVYTRTKI